jgi:hypothetical protein
MEELSHPRTTSNFPRLVGEFEFKGVEFGSIWAVDC